MLKFILVSVAMLGLAIGVQASNIGLSISWVCISNCTDFTETGILIGRSPEGTNWIILTSVATNITNYTDNGIADLTTFCYRVAGYNAYGTGDWSNVVCKKTVGKPSKVFQVTGLDSAQPYWFRVLARGVAGVRESFIVMIDPRRANDPRS